MRLNGFDLNSNRFSKALRHKFTNAVPWLSLGWNMEHNESEVDLSITAKMPGRSQGRDSVEFLLFSSNGNDLNTSTNVSD
jgi:hypothetical protein